MDRDSEMRDFVAARGHALARVAFLLTGNRHAAEDLVQDTYVVMVRQWRRIDSANPEPYVRRIMYSRFVDGWRRRRLREVLGLEADLPDRTDGSAAAVDRVVLGDALRRLTARQRALVVLRYYEDATEVQAAEILGVSPSTVKSETRVALKRLRAMSPETLAVLDPTAQGEVD